MTTAQQWPPTGGRLQLWLSDQLDTRSLRSKYDEAVSEAAEELTSFVSILRKRRQEVQRKLVELKWKTAEAGHDWLQSDDELADRIFRNLATLERAIAAKIEDIQKPDPKLDQYFEMDVNRNRSEIMKRYIDDLHMKLAA